MELNTYILKRQKLINTYLEKRMSRSGISRVDEAMKYSLFAGGKRLRPLLLMATADVINSKGYDLKVIAAGLEMIHTYSLIHDDLPIMDNDEYRRGKLTNHKVYGEALALLAGDGLLTLAFEVMLEQKGVDPYKLIDVVREVAMCAGNYGMVGGQTLDLDSENKQIDAKELKILHSAKTGALFIAAVRSGAILSGATDEELLALTKFADLFGLAFQIKDDILDVEGNSELMGKQVGSDEKSHKSTYVSLYTLDVAKALLEKTIKEAETCLEIFGEKAEPLKKLTLYSLKRNS